MSDLVGTVGKLAPVAFVFGAGVVFARRELIAAESSKPFADFAFLFAIPCYLFGSLYQSDLRRLFDPRAIAAYVVTALLGMVIVAAACRFGMRLDGRGTALRIMAAVQVNTTYFAIPVFLLLFGDASPIFPTILVQVCVLTVVVIAVLESATRQGDPGGSALAATVRGMRAALATPIVVACYLGVAADLVGLPVPRWSLDTLSFAGDAAAPVALFALGVHLGAAGLRVRSSAPDEYALIAFKCVALPLLAWVVGKFLFEIPDPSSTYLVLIAAMPAPQNLFIFAQRYDEDVDLAAAVVAKSTLLALALLPLWLVLAR